MKFGDSIENLNNSASEEDVELKDSQDKDENERNDGNETVELLKKAKKRKRTKTIPAAILGATIASQGIGEATAFAGSAGNNKIKKKIEYVSKKGETDSKLSWVRQEINRIRDDIFGKEEKAKTEKKIDKIRKEIQENKEPSREKIKAEEIVEACFEAYEHLDWPKDLLPKDLLIAQQLQESRLNPGVKSHKGAVGIMQNMEASVIDSIRYLNKLKRNENFNFRGPKKLTGSQLKDVMRLLSEHADYSRVFGKIYLVMLADNRYGYGVGHKDKNKNHIKAAQEKILAAYNGGCKRVKNRPKWRWPRESRKYCKKIFNYKQRISNIRNAFKKHDINDDDYLVALLAKEMDKPRNIKSKYRLLDKYINKIKNQQKRSRSDLSQEEIRRIFMPG